MSIDEVKKEEEKEVLKLIAVQLPEDVINELKKEAFEKFISLSDVLRGLIFDHLRSQGKMPERRME